jgi:prepilin-type N-terminal cleavage/methylation domain-containing protein
VRSLAQSTHVRRQNAGFTLIELLISFVIVAMVFGGILKAYFQAGRRIQWSGYSLAAQSLAVECIEQAKAATWDPSQSPPVNNLFNMGLQGASFTNQTYTGYSVGTLDVPYSGTNAIQATNFITISTVTVDANTNVTMQFMRVDTVWPFGMQGRNVYCTNTVCTMIAPDNASNGSF